MNNDRCDGINGLIYLCEGDLFNAGMSLMSLVPLGGIFAKGGKWVKKIAKWFSKSDEVIDTTKALTKYGGEAMELAQKAANKADETIELAQKAANKTDEVAGAVKGGRVSDVINKRNTPDQDALIQLAKEAKKNGGATYEEAEILLDWAKEYDVKYHGIEVHPNRPGTASNIPHFHIGKTGHIPIIGDIPTLLVEVIY